MKLSARRYLLSSFALFACVAQNTFAEAPKYAADVPDALITPGLVQTDYLGELEFFDGMHECTPPKNPRYRAGDIVVIEEDDGDGTVVGVVFGAISHATEELRTDARGMVSFDQIVRHATIEDIDTMDNRYKKIILDLLK